MVLPLPSAPAPRLELQLSAPPESVPSSGSLHDALKVISLSASKTRSGAGAKMVQLGAPLGVMSSVTEAQPCSWLEGLVAHKSTVWLPLGSGAESGEPVPRSTLAGEASRLQLSALDG